MRATIHVVVSEQAVREWLAKLYSDAEVGEPPEPLDYFRLRLEELIGDELAVATMFGPGFEFELGEVTAA